MFTLLTFYLLTLLHNVYFFLKYFSQYYFLIINLKTKKLKNFAITVTFKFTLNYSKSNYFKMFNLDQKEIR